MSLAQFLARQDRAREAEDAYNEAIRIHQKVVRDFPQDAEAHAALASDCSWQATFLEQQKRLPAALECHIKGVACLEAALRLRPERRDWVAALQSGLHHRGIMHQALNDWAEYERDLQRSNEVGERLDPSLLRLSRAQQRATAGDLTRAVRDADDLLLDEDLSGEQWYELAGLYAKLAESAPSAEQKERAAARAVQSLSQAIERGHTGPGALADAAAFRLLAGRADFKKVVAAQRAAK